MLTFFNISCEITTKKEKVMQIKILLVEDQKLMRIGIKSLFCDYPDLEIIGEASNGKEGC